MKWKREQRWSKIWCWSWVRVEGDPTPDQIATRFLQPPPNDEDEDNQAQHTNRTLLMLYSSAWGKRLRSGRHWCCCVGRIHAETTADQPRSSIPADSERPGASSLTRTMTIMEWFPVELVNLLGSPPRTQHLLVGLGLNS